MAALVSYASPGGEAPSASSASSESVTLVGLTRENDERVAYAPGTSRSWPASRHMLGVTVLSGQLTVYGPAGERQVYGAGDGFAAGWMAHRAVNETHDPVETLVTRFAAP